MEGIFIFAVFLLAATSPILIAVFLKQYFRYKSETNNKLADLDLKLAQSQNDLLQKRVVDLQSRVEVLERIVTDKRYELNQEISNL